jgi:hypothetical protein
LMLSSNACCPPAAGCYGQLSVNHSVRNQVGGGTHIVCSLQLCRQLCVCDVLGAQLRLHVLTALL